MSAPGRGIGTIPIVGSADTIEGRGRIIDNEQEVGGYPVQAATRQAFDPAGWDLRFMTRR